MTQIKATILTGGNHIETVSFPCSDDEIMRLTEQNEVGHKATVFINNLVGPKGLKSIEGTYANIHELNYLAKRGTLFHEICRLAEARHPKYLLLENVPGLLTHEGGQTFLAILTALEQLGYSLEWCVVNSANFGVPQDRKRVYIVGYLDSRLSGKIYPVRESTYSNLKQLIPGRQGQRVYSPDGAAVCLMSQGGGQGAKTGLYLIDMNENPKLTPLARCITARQDSGISNRKGEHSGVLITGARAILTRKDSKSGNAADGSKVPMSRCMR